MAAQVPKFSITLARYGCANRPFFHIVVSKRKHRRWSDDVIEQVGTFDPLPNKHNEKLVAINFERIRYWMAQNVSISVSVLELLGLSGMLPIHPFTYIRAKHLKQNQLI
ncbi:unnamed protein product, partial [Soboliphyme baturini]|uniref:Small ribosomal subunit protein bS16m n=1 Tax=Soboliphyme baturini TaxID=241478 RepID=A0A183IL71_9BILA